MNSKNKKLKIAIAGLGFGKKVHLEALKESNYLKPVAIYHYEKKQKSILEKETGYSMSQIIKAFISRTSSHH